MDFDGNYLSEPALAALTGEVVPALQAAVLAKGGLPFIYTGKTVRLLKQVMKDRQPSTAAPPLR